MLRITTRTPTTAIRGRIGVYSINADAIIGDVSPSAADKLTRQQNLIRDQISLINEALPHPNPDTDAELREQRDRLQAQLDALTIRRPQLYTTRGRRTSKIKRWWIKRFQNMRAANQAINAALKFLDSIDWENPTDDEIAALKRHVQIIRQHLQWVQFPITAGELANVQNQLQQWLLAATGEQLVAKRRIGNKAFMMLQNANLQALHPLPPLDQQPGLPEPPYPIDPDPEANRCDCKTWKYADELYARGHFDTGLWRRAIKARHKSAYDVWMKESCTLGNRGHYLPDEPSVSGGHSTDKAIPGNRWQPPQQCIRQYAQVLKTEYNEPAPFRWEIYVHYHSRDPRKPKLGINTITPLLYPNGWDQDPQEPHDHWEDTEIAYFAGTDSALECIELTVEANDGTVSTVRYIGTTLTDHTTTSIITPSHQRAGWWP